jgi:hypothetical protein
MHLGIRKKEKNKSSPSRPTRGPCPQTLISTATRAWQPAEDAAALPVLPLSLYSLSLPLSSLPRRSLSTAPSTRPGRAERVHPAARERQADRPWPRSNRARSPRVHPLRPDADRAASPRRARASSRAEHTPPCTARRRAQEASAADRAARSRSRTACIRPHTTVLRLRFHGASMPTVSSPHYFPLISEETDGIKPCNGVKRWRPMTSLVSFLLPSLSL